MPVNGTLECKGNFRYVGWLIANSNEPKPGVRICLMIRDFVLSTTKRPVSD